MRIHLMCDHKWRDLPPLVAIKLYLEQLGHRVTIASVRESMSLLPAVRPDCIVLNHFWGPRYNELARRLRKASIAVVVLPTEGAGRPIFHDVDRGDATDFSLVDRLYSWGPRNTGAIVERNSAYADRIVTTGCPRLDFYRKPLIGAVASRQQLAASYGFDPARPIITWATQFPHAHVQPSEPDVWERYCREMTDFGLHKCFATIGIDFRGLPKYHRALRDGSSEIFFRLARENPAYQFLIKPHPNERRGYYEELVRKFDLQNVKFCRSEYIWDVLYGTDVHIHRHCTTAVEAWMLNKPTIELAAIPDDFMAWPEREAGSSIAHDFAALTRLIRAFLDGRPIDSQVNAARSAYIRDWFGEQDGYRCLAVARDIDKFLSSRQVRGRSTGLFAAAGVKSRDTVSAVARHILAMPASASIQRHAARSLLDSFLPQSEAQRNNKNITRRDVTIYESRLRPLLALS